MSTTEKKTKGMCIATRCTSVEQFIQMFHRFVDEESFFVSTLNTRAPGLETSFSVQLVDGTPVLRGLCVVMQAWTDANNPFKTPGVRLGIKRLTANSMAVFERLLVTRSATKPPPFGATNGAPKAVAAVATKPGGVPAPKLPAPPPSSLAVVVAVPKSIPAKSPYSETAPTKSAPSRVEIKQPVRPSSEPSALDAKSGSDAKPGIEAKPEPARPVLNALSFIKVSPPVASRDSASELTPTPIPQPVPPEITDMTEEPTDVREPKTPVRELGALELAAEVAAPTELPKPVPDDSRTPGSELVLPANPLMNMTDESLKGYVDCTLYEETGNFFPVDDPDSFVDDVAPPPPLRVRAQTPPPIDGETRARTVTPLPPAPASSGFDGPESEGSAPRSAAAFDTALTPERSSSPAIVVPPTLPSPPIPRESVLVDPALIARGSMPAFDGGAYDSVSVEPAPAKLGLPLPAPASTSDRLATATRRRSRWLILGGVGAVAVTAAAIVVVMSSSNGGAAPEPKQSVKQLAQLAPPVAKTADQEPTPPDEAEDPAPGEGPPVVGAGPCSVVVNTTPAGSIVQLDDTKLGPSPITVAATCDKHKLDISHARYQPTTKLVTLTEGKPESVEVTLSRPTHIVTVTSNPPGATIFIDGRRAGTTPTKLSVLGFVQVKLELKKTGFQPAQAKLYSRVSPDQVAVRLTKW